RSHLNFKLDDEHLLVQRAIRDFARERLAPNARRWDEEERFPIELVPELAELGLTGITVPTELGGAGFDVLGNAIAIEEVAAGDGSIALSVAAHNGLCLGHLMLAGSDEQRRRVVARDAAGLRPGKTEKKLGLHASATAVVHLDNVRVPATQLLGTPGQAFRDVKQVLDKGRIGIAALAVGLARAAFEYAVGYART